MKFIKIVINKYYINYLIKKKERNFQRKKKFDELMNLKDFKTVKLGRWDSDREYHNITMYEGKNYPY
jgi:hypothetical protein